MLAVTVGAGLARDRRQGPDLFCVAAPPIVGKARSYRWINKGLSNNKLSILSGRGWRAAALSLACIVPLYGAAGRLASHPATTAIMDNLLFESP
jgi:hypothetical protein